MRSLLLLKRLGWIQNISCVLACNWNGHFDDTHYFLLTLFGLYAIFDTSTEKNVNCAELNPIWSLKGNFAYFQPALYNYNVGSICK